MHILENFIIIHRFAPYHDWPMYLDLSNVKQNIYRSTHSGSAYKKGIVDVWNNKDNIDLTMMAQEIANMVDATDDSIISAWALLIRKQEYDFSETESVKTKADSY